MLHRFPIVLLVCAFCAAIAAPARADVSKGDKKFMTDAAEGGMTEVKLSQLALEKSSNDEVKSFAQKMVEDHGKANDELMALAKTKNVELPADIGKNQKTYDKLAKLSGADFDKAYVKQMLDDHKHTVHAFEKHAETGDDVDLKTWAAKTLPALQSHLTMVESLDKTVNK